MQERSIRPSLWIAAQLDKFAAWLQSRVGSTAPQSKFVDLAPTDEADEAGVYAEALLFATTNPKVTNIALTGPYGSGKSSIVQTFLKRYSSPALHISLAAFVPGPETAGGTSTRQEIERSILQQLLYGADANKLPLSRFKRIQSPGPWSIFRSLSIMLGVLSLWFIFLKRDAVFDGSFFSPFALSNTFQLASFAIAVLFLWTLVHHFYVASFGISLKSISLKDIEMRPSSDNPDSILNRHLDEIIYFFQTTNYDLVVIEDLDRFENADIFVTLREINGLVNKNAGVKRTIRFLYALRDDMFVNTDRTKFFEFIVPVIPIINTSNSIDKVLEQGKRLALDERLDPQFLREVSRYLNDLRLIQNIFNEYAVYVSNLESDEENLLDPNKLLAILIYKNVYPRDFEQLHRGEGNLAGLLARKDELIAKGEAGGRTEIKKLEQQIADAELQVPSDLTELRKIYAMTLIQKLPANVTNISHDRATWITPQQLAADEALDKIIESSSITIKYNQGYQDQLDISSLQSDVDSRRTYQQRRTEIENKAAAKKSEILHRISVSRSRIATLRTIKFNELVRLNADGVDDLFSGFRDKGDLARFLILEGHLDDTFYQYTSLFHSGRLSPNDNKFLIKIRAFVTPEPNFPIDNPKEVIAAMRPEDFSRSYVLNVKLVDCLLGDPLLYGDQLAKLLSFIASDFEGSEEFLQAYYDGGAERAGLLSGLSSSWEGYVPTILASKRAAFHVTQLVAHVPDALLQKLAASANDLSHFVSQNLPQILEGVPEIAPQRLACLGFEIEELAAIDEYPAVVRFMYEKGLYLTSVTNLEYVYRSILGETDLEAFRTANFSTIRSKKDDVLLAKLEKDFETYFVDVLLGLDTNRREDTDAILQVLQQDGLDPEDVEAFLERQENLLQTLNGVPVGYHALLFKHHGIEPTWANCFAFLNSEGFQRESLISFLDREDVRPDLLTDQIPEDADSLPLRRFILEAAELSDAAYQAYIRALPKKFAAFPEDLEDSKLQILIDENAITFSKKSFEALTEENLRVRYIAANISEFLAGPDEFGVDDDLLEKLLKSRISLTDKRAIVGLLDLHAAAGVLTRAALVGGILDATDTNVANVDANVARSLIVHSRPIATQISLFNKLEPVLENEDVRRVLDNLPRPYSDIKTGYYVPRLPMTSENMALVRWLHRRKIISSWSQGGMFSDDIRVNLRRR